VSDLARSSALPLRPLTTGELLDAAVVLLRARPARLIVVGVLLAVAEQAVLFPLRRFADQDISLFPATGRLSEFGLLLLAGFGTEALIIAIMGGVAAADGGRALLGAAAPPRPAPRPVSVAVIALVAMLVSAAATTVPFLVVLEPLQDSGFVAAGLLVAILWPLPYGLIGLAAPAAVIEQRGPGSALLRSVRLASRDTLRAVWIQLLGWLSWMLIRLALILATIALVELIFTSPSATVDNIVLAGAAVLVNAVAYPVLGCLDVMLLLEGRMRTEGLDIVLRRTLARGVATDATLQVPR
jgi:hypothetical protein